MRFSPTALTAVLLTACRQSLSFGVLPTRRHMASAAALAQVTATGPQRKKVQAQAQEVPWLLAGSNLQQQCAVQLPHLMTVRGGASTSTQLDASTATAEAETTQEAPVEIFRKDYQPLPFTVSKVSLDINIRPGETTIVTEMNLLPNPSAKGGNSLILDGDETSVTLKEITMDGKVLEEGVDYKKTHGHIELLNVPSSGAVVKTLVATTPEDNTQLSGLYKSGSMYCTQCEAMGFRRMSYFPDRPDNMAVFESVRIEADKSDYPVLLSNGNLVEEGDVDGTRHFAGT